MKQKVPCRDVEVDSRGTTVQGHRCRD